MSVAAVFTGRACPSCGWNESSRNAGAMCFVCRAPMVQACPERAPSVPQLDGAMQRERERLAHGRCLTCGLPLLTVDEEAGRLHCVRHVPVEAGE